MTIQDEKQAFRGMLQELLTEHRGKFVLMNSGEVKGFWSTMDEAYREGLAKYGPGNFLVEKVSEESPQNAAFCLDLGLIDVR